MPNNAKGFIRGLQTFPFCWILVPLFFMVKNASLYRPAVTFSDFFLLLAQYLVGAVLLYCILYALFGRKGYKAALFSTLLLGIYFFYADFDGFLQKQSWLYPFSRYRWSLTATVVLLFFAWIYIRRLQERPGKAIGFLNVLLLLFCLSEIIPLVVKLGTGKGVSLLGMEEAAPGDLSEPIHSPHRNIYFLLFDEYQGNAGLKQAFNYPNTALKNDLSARGFFAPPTVRSNYNFTFFSMPSIFNMNYLKGNIQGATPSEDLLLFSSGISLIKDSRLVGFLQRNDYQIINLSPFALDSSGGSISQFESVVSGRSLFRDQTLYFFLKEKFGWKISNKRILRLLNPSDYNNQYYNEYIKERLWAASAPSVGGPKFVYAHFFLPHAPFLKDSSGHDVDFRELMRNSIDGEEKYLNERYLDYLKYANSVMTASIDTLLRNDPGSVIVVMSDHGYRHMEPKNKAFQFDNQFYIRTPGRVYSGWPDTVDAVNAFRILLNKEFNQRLDYLPYRSYEFTLPPRASGIYQR